MCVTKILQKIKLRKPLIAYIIADKNESGYIFIYSYQKYLFEDDNITMKYKKTLSHNGNTGFHLYKNKKNVLDDCKLFNRFYDDDMLYTILEVEIPAGEHITYTIDNSIGNGYGKGIITEEFKIIKEIYE